MLGAASGPVSLTASIRTGPGDPTPITQNISASAIRHRPVLAVVFGDNQVAPPGSTLPTTIFAQLTDTTTSGTRVPVPGVTVTWTAVGVGATATQPTSVTDAQGRASTVWKIASTIGPQTLGVSVPGATTNDPASVTQTTATATAQLAPARVLRVVSGATQVGIVGRPQRSPLVVEYVTIDVTTGAVNAVVGASVSFTPSATHGTVTPVTVATDFQGRASVLWTMGAGVGTQSMTVATPVLAGFDAASVFSIGVSATAEPVNIMLQDDFSVGNQWLASATRNDFNAWTFTRTVVPTGGNGGGFARMSHAINLTTNPTFASISSQFLYTGGTYNPSTQGPITAIDYSVDRQTAAGIYDAFVVVQNNVEYRAEFPSSSVFANTTWQTGSLQNLVPANFSPAPGPNFVDGGAMQFGYTRGSSQRFAGFSHTHDVDNWVVTIKR
jgi:hypothetical protein